jgi:hypothetical protein
MNNRFLLQFLWKKKKNCRNLLLSKKSKIFIIFNGVYSDDKHVKESGRSPGIWPGPGPLKKLQKI